MEEDTEIVSYYREDSHPDPPEERTIVVIGCSQSGTKMLTQVLIDLGVPMVRKRFNVAKLEDLDLTENLDNRKEFFNQVSIRNRENILWGFKCPGIQERKGLLRLLRNPIYLMIMKSSLPVVYRRFGNNNLRLLEKLSQTLGVLRAQVDSAVRLKESVHVLSWTQAALSPRDFIQEVAHIVGVDTPQDRVKKALFDIYTDVIENPWLYS